MKPKHARILSASLGTLLLCCAPLRPLEVTNKGIISSHHVYAQDVTTKTVHAQRRISLPGQSISAMSSNNTAPMFHLNGRSGSSSSAVSNFLYRTASSALHTSIDSGIKVQTDLIYSNTYYEKILTPNSTLNTALTITNTNPTEKAVKYIVAQYDSRDILVGFPAWKDLTVPAEQSIQTAVDIAPPPETGYYLKIFFLDFVTLKPITSSIRLDSQWQDYYSDTFENAAVIDCSRSISGKIDAPDDADILGFSVPVSGDYMINVDVSSPVTCQLYNNNETILGERAIDSAEGYIITSLSPQKTYYVKFTGNNQSVYSCSIKRIEATEAECGDIYPKQITTDDRIHVYTITPTEDKLYHITAIGDLSVQGALYDSSSHLLASNRESDEYVSFRISHTLQRNTKYYIIISPKISSGTGTYTLYIEEPLQLLSVK